MKPKIYDYNDCVDVIIETLPENLKDKFHPDQIAEILYLMDDYLKEVGIIGDKDVKDCTMHYDQVDQEDFILERRGKLDFDIDREELRLIMDGELEYLTREGIAVDVGEFNLDSLEFSTNVSSKIQTEKKPPYEDEEQFKCIKFIQKEMKRTFSKEETAEIFNLLVYSGMYLSSKLNKLLENNFERDEFTKKEFLDHLSQKFKLFNKKEIFKILVSENKFYNRDGVLRALEFLKKR